MPLGHPTNVTPTRWLDRSLYVIPGPSLPRSVTLLADVCDRFCEAAKDDSFSAEFRTAVDAGWPIRLQNGSYAFRLLHAASTKIVVVGFADGVTGPRGAPQAIVAPAASPVVRLVCPRCGSSRSDPSVLCFCETPVPSASSLYVRRCIASFDEFVKTDPTYADGVKEVCASMRRAARDLAFCRGFREVRVGIPRRLDFVLEKMREAHFDPRGPDGKADVPERSLVLALKAIAFGEQCDDFAVFGICDADGLTGVRITLKCLAYP